MPALNLAQELSRAGQRWSRTAQRPCDACHSHANCAAEEIACPDFAAWVLLNQHRTLRREATPGMFNLIFEREDAQMNSDLVDQSFYAQIVREAKRKARVARDVDE